MDALTELYQKGQTDKERVWYLAEYARIDEIRQMYAGISTEPDSRKAIHRNILFHCTSGKDRTGIISAIFLYALGCDRKDIIVDYNASAGEISETGFEPSPWFQVRRG